jgi:hypothetical protein
MHCELLPPAEIAGVRSMIAAELPTFHQLSYGRKLNPFHCLAMQVDGELTTPGIIDEGLCLVK